MRILSRLFSPNSRSSTTRLTPLNLSKVSLPFGFKCSWGFIVLKNSEDFEIAENDTLPLDYFNILDKDQDGFISFQDFLGPFLG